MKKFKHGDRVMCTISGTEITDAKISINKSTNGFMYICQNIVDTSFTQMDDLLGYSYGQYLDEDFESISVKDLRLAEKSFDDPQIGDVYLEDGNEEEEVTVLAVVERLVFVSCTNEPHVSGAYYTKEELINDGYTIKQDPIVEVGEETVTIGEHTFNKAEFEEATKDLKEIS